MTLNELENPEDWASKTFASAELGDPRRTDRLVQIAAALAEEPAASLPTVMRSVSETMAAYRFLNTSEISHEQIMQPHWVQTRQIAEEHAWVLLIADLTEINLTTHTSTTGVGPVGQGDRGRGFYLHSVLAVDAETKQILGCAYQEPFVRQPAPAHETRAQRRGRPRESQIWERSAQQIGAPPNSSHWVHVGDSGADIFTFWEVCRHLGADFVIRVCQDRLVALEAEEQEAGRVLHHLRKQAESQPAQDARVVHLRAEHQRPARDALLQINWSQVLIQPPQNGASWDKQELPVWVVRVWEPEPPAGTEPLEWLLVTTVPTTTTEQAWERVRWYGWRWLLEDFHHALKTGCRIEQQQMRSVDALFRLLGILTPIALRLLCLREIAQTAPETDATEVLDAQVVQVVAHLAKRPTAHMSARELWRTIASFGGYFNRKSDGPPGWKTLWRGWLYVQTVLEGVHLAASFSPL
jgi:hypothetical protein